MPTPKATPKAGPNKPKAKRRPPIKPIRRNGKVRAHGLKFTEEVKLAILTRIRNGEIHELAAIAAGISDATLKRWLARGRDELDTHERALDRGEDPGDLGEYAVFYLDLRQNEELCLVEDNRVIVDAAHGGDVQAAMWRLTKLRPKQFGDRSRVTVADHDESDIDALGDLLARLDAMSGRLGLEETEEVEPDGGDGSADR